MAVVYKITREDGLSYIGITSNLKKRLSGHRRSLRFTQLKISTVEVLFDGDYEECEALEESFIAEYDTFKNGLNLTSKGKGKSQSQKFNTRGYKFSQRSRTKMSESRKRRTDRVRGYKHSVHTRQNWSLKRKGKIWGPVKIDSNVVVSNWHKFSPATEQMLQLVCNLHDSPDRYRFKNNKPFSHSSAKLKLFCEMLAKKFNATPRAIKRILKNESLI